MAERWASNLGDPVTTRRFLPAAVLVTSLALSGCGTFRDEIAATVNGEQITVQQVETVAADAPALGLGAATDGETPGRVPADPRRLAINLIVQDRAFVAELDRLGATSTPEDSQAAEQQLGQIDLPSMDAKVSELVTRLVTNQAAIIRLQAIASAEIDDAAIAEYFDANRDQFGAITCLEGIAGVPDAVVEARGQIALGASFEAVVTADPQNLQPIDQSGTSTCVPAGAIQDPGLGDVVYESEPGQLVGYDTQDQQGGPISLLIRVTSREPASLDDESVAAQIRQTLEQEATAAAQDASQQVFADVIGRAEVTVDPRYGRFDPSSQTIIVPPPTPTATDGALAIPGL